MDNSEQPNLYKQKQKAIIPQEENKPQLRKEITFGNQCFFSELLMLF